MCITAGMNGWKEHKIRNMFYEQAKKEELKKNSVKDPNCKCRLCRKQLTHMP